MSKDTDKPLDDFAADEATGHSDYKPTDTHDANAKHQLSGMYENWFLDYASYVILKEPYRTSSMALNLCSVVFFTPCGAWKTDATTK